MSKAKRMNPRMCFKITSEWINYGGQGKEGEEPWPPAAKNVMASKSYTIAEIF